MDLGNAFLGLVLCGLCLTVQSEMILEYNGQELYPMKEDATLSCLFNIPNSNLSDVEAAWWKTIGSSSPLKIGISRYEESKTFKYPNAPSNIILSSARFASSFADLIIENIGIRDVADYECEVEDRTLRETKRIKFSIDVFNDPTVTIEDVETDLDIRPAPEQPETPAETSEPPTDTSKDNEDATEDSNEQPAESDNVEESTSPDSNEQDDPTVTIVRCHVVNTYPKPSKIVFDGSSPKFSQKWSIPPSEFEDSEEMNEDGTYNVSARLRIVPAAKFDKAVFTCSAFITSEDRKVSSEDQSSPITVKHHPSEVQTVISPSSTVNEFEEVTVFCNSDGNPLPKKYLKLPSGNEIEANEGYSFTATRDTSGMYDCIVTDDNGNTLFGDSEGLIVKWMTAPVIEGPSVANVGGSVSFTCSSDSNRDDIAYQWSKDGEYIESGNVLKLDSLTTSNSGTYKCEVSGDRELTSEHELKVEVGCVPTIAEPVISGSTKDKDAHNVRITCTASGDPTCIMKLSSYKGIKPEYDGNKAVLVIPEYKKQMQKPQFVCEASNKISTNNVSLYLNDDDLCCNEPVAGGVSTGVIILIIIIVILVVFGVPLGCYLFKKRKTSKGGNSTSKNEKTVDDVEADKLHTPTDEDGL